MVSGSLFLERISLQSLLLRVKLQHHVWGSGGNRKIFLISIYHMCHYRMEYLFMLLFKKCIIHMAPSGKKPKQVMSLGNKWNLYQIFPGKSYYSLNNDRCVAHPSQICWVGLAFSVSKPRSITCVVFKGLNHALWTSLTKTHRMQTSEQPDSVAVTSTHLSSLNAAARAPRVSCGSLYSRTGLPEGRSGCFSKYDFECPLKSKPGLVLWFFYYLAQWCQTTEVQWETAGPTPHVKPSASPFSRESFPLCAVAKEALGVLIYTSECPHALATHYLAFILGWESKHWIRLWTSRSGRSLMDNLIPLLACSQDSQVHKNWENLPNGSIFWC